MKNKIAFIIPVYNHPHYLYKLTEYLIRFDYPIILVNDGSDQYTTDIMYNIKSENHQVILVEHNGNKGKGAAVMTAFNEAVKLDCSHVLQLDADGQHNWEDISKFLNTSEKYPNDVILGCPIYDESVPKLRHYGRYLTHIWVWINSLSFNIKDSMCGFRVYPLKAVMPVIQKSNLRKRMGFDSEILVRMKWNGIHFINIPTRVIYPEKGISHFQPISDNIEISKMHASLFFSMLSQIPRLIKNKLKS